MINLTPLPAWRKALSEGAKAREHKDIYSGGEIKPSKQPNPKSEVYALIMCVEELQDSNRDLIELNKSLVAKELQKDRLVMKVLGIGVLIGVSLGLLIGEAVKLLA